MARLPVRYLAFAFAASVLALVPASCGGGQ